MPVPAISPACPLGGFAAYYPHTHDGPGCIVPAHQPPVDTVGMVLTAAEKVGLKVHLGLGYPYTSRIPQGMNSTAYYRNLASVNWGAAQQLWANYGTRFADVLGGWYTDVEESNSIGELPLMSALTGHYLEPLARDIHNMTGMGKGNGTPVWASPYYVGNLTRHSQASYMSPRFYGDFWGQVFEMAPDLDFIAPQDSMGAQGNSFANVTTFLTELRGASTRAGRKMMSNVELFEVWPQSCQWSPTTGICKGRRPAPFERIKAQMANEASLADELIAWEWHSCLSPYGSTNETTEVYLQYKAYVLGE